MTSSGTLEQHINALLRLNPGWDGHRGQPVTRQAVETVRRLLPTLTDDLSLPPQLFPLSDGGLQMEWHAGRSIEIEVDAAGDAHVLITNEAGGILTNDDLALHDSALLASTARVIHELSRLRSNPPCASPGG